MSKERDGDVRGFCHTGSAWYADSAKSSGERDSVSVGWYCPDGQGTSGEFVMAWVELGGRTIPHLRLYSDSWDCFTSMADLFAALAERDEQDITPVEFCELLLSLGFRDITPRESPYKSKQDGLRASAKQKLTPEEYAAIAQG